MIDIKGIHSDSFYVLYIWCIISYIHVRGVDSMIRFPHSFRFKLMLVFLLSSLIISIILMITLPSYFSKTMKKENEVLINSTLTAVEANLNNYLDELERLTIMPYFNSEFMNSILMVNNSQYNDLNEYQRYLLRQSINYTLSYYLQNTREDIRSALFISNDLMSFITTKKGGISSIFDTYDIIGASWYQEAITTDQSYVFINAHKQDYLGTDDYVFSIARQIKDPVTQKKLGVLMADIDTNIIEKILSDINLGVSSIILVVDGQNQLIFSTKAIDTALFNQLLANQTRISSSDRTIYLPITRSLEKLPWKIHVLMSETEIKSKISGMYVMGYIFILLALFVVLILNTFMSKHLTKPFNEMLYVIDAIEKGNLDLRFDELGNDEIAYLRNNLNTMLDKIKALNEREYLSSIAMHKAEYHALQAQIQPHFLYNTLTGLIGLNRLGNTQKVEDTILNMTSLMRYILEQGDISTLKDEIRLLKSYCELQQLRFGDRLHYEFDIDTRIVDMSIPKLLLQPLVENAIIHGLEPKGTPGHLMIKTSAVTDIPNSILIEIIDDGVGFNVDAELSSNHVGLTNSLNRIKYMYPQSQIQIESSIGLGTSISILIDTSQNV